MQFGPDDQALIDEFEAAPFGNPSRPLREILNRFRSAPAAGKYCLLVLKPHTSYQLARLSGVPGEQPTPIEGKYYSSQLEAEIDVFKLRLREYRAMEASVQAAVKGDA